ncbi:MAG TPA: heme o synthase [Thermoplasmata archaeon]|nr:heme o synthase [Thermoplasmata archaeon]
MGETPRWKDYLALTKPGITGLIVAVGIGGYFLALTGPVRLVPLALLVAFGASASAGAAMLNHYFDRDLDAQMRRTRHRPLPEGRIAPDVSVFAGGIALSAIGVGGAALLLNPLAAFAILLGGVTYVGVYTLWLKRRSSWNIVVGGFAGSAPALAGSAVAVGHFTAGAYALALLLFLWTPPHFWSLALLLRKDYAAVGLPMLPKMDDPAFSGKVVVVSAALLLPATILVWWLAPLPWWAGGTLVALGIAFVALTSPLWGAVLPGRARMGFIYSGIYLLAVLVVLVASGLIAHPALAVGA